MEMNLKNAKVNPEQIYIFLKTNKDFKCIFVPKNINELGLMKKLREMGAFPMDFENDYTNQVFLEFRNGKRQFIDPEDSKIKLKNGSVILVETTKKSENY